MKITNSFIKKMIKTNKILLKYEKRVNQHYKSIGRFDLLFDVKETERKIKSLTNIKKLKKRTKKIR